VAEHMLTTTDNPFNPFTQFDEWLIYDEMLGYYTPGLLARYTFSSAELSEADEDQAIEDAIDSIIDDNILDVYVKVSQEENSS
jgi:hypothetical protein